MALVERVAKVPEELEGQVFGQFDAWLKRIERTLNVTVIARDSELRVIGSEPAADGAKRVLEDLAALAEQGSVITEQNVNYALSLAMEKTDG
ncbi:MAG TPA: phosphate starvation-inducible protein PhoH, partial [Lachnospiraceae bacterium]|nr:phosphate starvation-inducible protein PhoH [Lachnospiraceae bacterium]